MIFKIDLYENLLNMLNWTHQVQSSMGAVERNLLSPKSWIKEFCCVKFGLPRRSGHSTFAQQLFYKFFKKPVFIAPTESICMSAGFLFSAPNVGLPTTLNKFKGNSYDGIIVDCVSLFSANEIDKIYETFEMTAYRQDNFIILLLE